MTAMLRSPHTVELYDFGVTEDGVFYYAMELLDGIDLEALVKKFGPQPPARVAAILRQVCLSLGDAHRHGMIHRDIKPTNIFLCRMGNEHDFAKVLDFGLVKVLDGNDVGMTVEGATTGTPAYMAPEVALGNPIDGRTDITDWAASRTGCSPAAGLRKKAQRDHDGSREECRWCRRRK
jgi:serine/threonine-protein kinase